MPLLSCFSELPLKQSLGLIQLIKIQLMFALMAPQRQLERQARVIPASDEAFMAHRWRKILQQYDTLLRRGYLWFTHKHSQFNIVSVESLLWLVAYYVHECIFVCVCEGGKLRKLLWLRCWQPEDIWNSGITFVFEKNNNQTISVLYSDVVLAPHPLLTSAGFLAFVFNQLSVMLTLSATEATRPTCDYRYCHQDGVHAAENFFRKREKFSSGRSQGVGLLQVRLPDNARAFVVVQAVRYLTELQFER